LWKDGSAAIAGRAIMKQLAQTNARNGAKRIDIPPKRKKASRPEGAAGTRGETV
jgi:hypothetical protein